MHYKVRQNGTVESRAIYNILGIGNPSHNRNISILFWFIFLQVKQ